MIYRADIRKVKRLRQGKPRLVITEPYYEEEYWPLWTELMRFTVRVEAKTLVVFSEYERQQQHYDALTKEDGLPFAGAVDLHFDAPYKKPAFIFGAVGGELITSLQMPGGMWPFEQYAPFIVAFTKSEDLVCDPFLGSNHTAKVMALWLGRRFEGFDIKASAVNQTAGTLKPKGVKATLDLL